MKELAQLIITACEHFNINSVVISPGSRNAPLTIGFHQSKINALSIVDERSAAFFALGIAQQTQKPVALVCTSGSALLNYYPAIAEAFYSNIPLLIISADRPKHLIDIGDGQTIRQENVFKNHILFSANLKAMEDLSGFENLTGLKEETADEKVTYNSKLIAKAISTSIEKKAPVHINAPFDEPLYESNSKFKIQNFKFQNKKRTKAKNYEIPEHLTKIWNTSERKLILIGVHFPSEELQLLLDKITDDENVLVMTETTSNFYNDTFINSIDKLITKLNDTDFKNLQPEILLTFGGLVVSKRIKQFLRKYQPKHHWHVDKHTKLDTYFCLSEFIEENPSVFLRALINRTEKPDSLLKSDLRLRPDRFLKPVRSEKTYQSYWLSEKKERNQKHQQFLKSATYSDLKVMELVLQSIPTNCQLQISNSSVIRYTQLFDINKTLQVFCNRGTSGIDGSTSTAIGASFASEKQTVFITGDISFFYDSNALWNAYIPKNFRIILLNNSGGGIFRIIPGPKQTNSLPYFETPHNLTASHLAAMFGFEYQSAKNTEEVKTHLTDFYTASKKPKILEIFTPPQINDVVLQEYFNSL